VRVILSSTRVRLLILTIVTLVIVVVLVAAGVFLFVSQQQAAAQQPILFPHVSMVQAGVDCLYCHTEAIRSPVAGIPSVDKCMGCHKTIATNVPAIQKVSALYQSGQPIEWVLVNRLPRFVYFSHRVHVVSGAFNCERCHGDVGHMTVDQPVVRMTMGWCLSCHETQPNANQLKDCIVCHQ
jgi:hypothetical protein